MDRIAIVTVVYNNYSDLDDYFTSLNAQVDKDFLVFVADLSTKAQDIDVPKYAKKISGENKGYAFGLNLGLDEALRQGCNKFIFMNNDTIAAPDFVQKARESLKENPGTLIGGKIYYAQGYEYHKDRYGKNDLGKVLWYAGGLTDWKNGLSLHRGVDEVDVGQYDAMEKTEFVTGCLMIFDKEVVDRAGRMDETYFMYFEDADWNERIKRAGLSIVYDPAIVLWHKNAQSTGGSGSGFHEKYQRRNQLKFAMKYAPLRTQLHLIKNYIISSFQK